MAANIRDKGWSSGSQPVFREVDLGVIPQKSRNGGVFPNLE
jgi:hypothetical protein